jgi:hypothetical protein
MSRVTPTTRSGHPAASNLCAKDLFVTAMGLSEAGFRVGSPSGGRKKEGRLLAPSHKEKIK